MQLFRRADGGFDSGTSHITLYVSMVQSLPLNNSVVAI
jgi:hypothetical protein